MMKSIFTITLTILLSSLFAKNDSLGREIPQSFSEQVYTVVAVRGNVKNVSHNQWLHRKSQFRKGDKLLFSSGAKLLVIDQTRKSFMCLASTNEQGYHLRPCKTVINTRPGMPLNILALEAYISADPYYIFGNEISIQVGKVAFPLNEEHFFFLRYEWKETQVDKMLTYLDDSFVISASQIYQVEGVNIELQEASKYQIFYYDAVAEVATFVGDFRPVFLDDEELKAEISILLESLNESTHEEKKKEVETYLFNFYPDLNMTDMKAWLEETYGF